MSKLWQIGLSLGAAAVMMAQTAPAPPQPPSAPRAHNAGSPIQMVTYLGVAGEDLDAVRRQALKVKEDHGIVVTMISDSAPADKAGLKRGDVILEYNGHAVESFEQLRGLIQDSTAGKPVKVLISRNGVTQTLSAVPETRRVVAIPGMEIPMPMGMPMPPQPMPAPAMPEIPRFQIVVPSTPLGILGEELSEEPQFAEFFGVREGILVKTISPNSPAEKAGMKAGDVVVKVDDRHIASARDLQRALRAAENKPAYQVTVMRNKKEAVLNVTP
jgi:serine protease Do